MNMQKIRFTWRVVLTAVIGTILANTGNALTLYEGDSPVDYQLTGHSAIGHKVATVREGERMEGFVSSSLPDPVPYLSSHRPHSLIEKNIVRRLKPYFRDISRVLESSSEPLDKSWATQAQKMDQIALFINAPDPQVPIALELADRSRQKRSHPILQFNDFRLLLNGPYFDRYLGAMDKLSGSQRRDAEIFLKGLLIKEIGGAQFDQKYPYIEESVHLIGRYLSNAMERYRDASKSSGFDLKRAFQDRNLVELVKYQISTTMAGESSGYVKMMKYFNSNGMSEAKLNDLAVWSSRQGEPGLFKGFRSFANILRDVPPGDPDVFWLVSMYHIHIGYATALETMKNHAPLNQQEKDFWLAYLLEYTFGRGGAVNRTAIHPIDPATGKSSRAFMPYLREEKYRHPRPEFLKKSFSQSFDK